MAIGGTPKFMDNLQPPEGGHDMISDYTFGKPPVMKQGSGSIGGRKGSGSCEILDAGNFERHGKAQKVSD